MESKPEKKTKKKNLSNYEIKKKFTAWKPRYREPLTRRRIFRTKKAGASPKIYRQTQREAKFQTSSTIQKKFL